MVRSESGADWLIGIVADMLGRTIGFTGGLPSNDAPIQSVQHLAMEARNPTVYVNSGFLTCAMMLRPLSILPAAVRTFGLDTKFWGDPPAIRFSQS